MPPESHAEVVAHVLAQARSRREDVVALCADLVAAPSVNPPGDTRQVADVVAAALRGLGLTPRLERQLPEMPSVLAEVDSGRPGPHLVLNVHLDTMPPGDESTWSVPVWQLTRRDGRLHGLGMGNMKGAVAAMVHALSLLAETRQHWTGRVTFTAVSDEVVFGDNGAAFLLRTHPDLYADGLLCGEGPGYRRLALGEKGVLWLAVTATGTAGHSSSVRFGESASARLALAVRRIDALTGSTGQLPPELAGVMGAGPDPGLELTANVGTLTAGTFVGQVATTGRAEVDLRLPPGIGADAAEDLVRAAVRDIPTVEVSRIKGWDPNWTGPDEALTRAWRRAGHDVGVGEPTYAVRLPASDASRWRRRGVPALCYGPQPTLSAGVDDHAEEDEVLRCVALYALSAFTFLSGGGPTPGDAG
jgi:succinyl-diaminopimelate desuccinylase